MKQGSRNAGILQAFFFGGFLAATTTVWPTHPAQSRTDSINFVDSPKVILDEAWQLVNQEYVDGSFNHTNWEKVRSDLLKPTYSSKEEAYT
ncbi:MAG: peptidase S41, partial [Thermosynechococcaceae cyanobacterium]